MNLILFEGTEIGAPLARTDGRAAHLLEVLRRKPGDTFDAGLVNGPRGRGRVESIAADHVELSFVWGDPPPPPDPLTLLIGLPRPQTARDILRDATTLGVARLVFAITGKTGPGYAASALWRENAWRRQVLEGAAQAFDTRIPEVTHGVALATALAGLAAGGTRLALDNYEATTALADAVADGSGPLVLAIGPERGWTGDDRAVLRAAGFVLAGLGARVLRTETAAIAALTLAKARRGWL
jgi:RsmE family RNA methyltransferase